MSKLKVSKPRVKHVVKCVTVTGFAEPRYYYICTCGKIGKRKKDQEINEKAAKSHAFHKYNPPKRGLVYTRYRYS